MTYQQLRSLVDAVELAYHADTYPKSYTKNQRAKMCAEGDMARMKLEDLGVEFDE